ESALPLPGLIEAQASHMPRGSTAVIITPSAADSVYRTADLLKRRGMRPLVVLIDNLTFGGYFSAEPVAGQLTALQVPNCRVVEGADLASVLSLTTNLRQMS
ncbi:MAG: hypothetical protein IT316_09480, partial [Anaerolineales bacterium]|nr:hypothetical protein [Anaerolineales bacterium]